ncbi:hypothetical protein [Oceanobacillus bengalensis]|uniref:Uncharacterized protein n=1 Tax=Oceanobacillus bengalensis TaxID=1435466 RepID=A0A494Z3N3_9BACI|nr:hypothetical protein [Oceanobacillus bengalensis]RKQ17066.1 hypothetical protein D8M05_05185 [Oceanobacillus bengalensis]
MDIRLKAEKLLGEIGYFNLEFQNESKIDDGIFFYWNIGYLDAAMIIQVTINNNIVEIMDCYAYEENTLLH